jgi:hypothetical protein
MHILPSPLSSLSNCESPQYWISNAILTLRNSSNFAVPLTKEYTQIYLPTCSQKQHTGEASESGHSRSGVVSSKTTRAPPYVPIQLPPRRRGQTKKGEKKTPKHSSNAKETKQQMKSYGRSECKEEEVVTTEHPAQTDNTMQFSTSSSSSSKTHPKKFAAEK